MDLQSMKETVRPFLFMFLQNIKPMPTLDTTSFRDNYMVFLKIKKINKGHIHIYVVLPALT